MNWKTIAIIFVTGLLTLLCWLFRDMQQFANGVLTDTERMISLQKSNHKFKNKIISITSDNLVLEGFHNFQHVLIYSRTKKEMSTANCDIIYDFAEVMPQYNKGDSGLSKYIRKELIPVIGNCMNYDSLLISSLNIVLTIDKEGKVIDATFPKFNAPDSCKDELREKLKAMTGWIPGQMKGQPICCHFAIPISCLKWQKQE